MATVEELCKALWDITESDRPDRVLTLTKRIVDAAHAEGVAEGEEGIMSCPLYTHGWANDDDYRGEVHCCNRRGHEISWNPKEMKAELKKAHIDPDILAPTKEREK